MRLVKCYVENFGGLNKFEFNFENELNQLNKPNGFGKTTLAEFIKAIFYGFDNKGRDINNTRKRYYPWNGGKYGGYIIFSLNNKLYRVERYFGKTAKGDTFNLYDVNTNTISKDYSHNIGVEIFGLDADSFIRSIYIKNTPVDGFNTDKIQAKLTNLVEDTNDVNNFNKAIGSLKDKQANIISNRRSESDYKIACDNITLLEQEINELQRIINEKSDIDIKYNKCIQIIEDDKVRLKEIKGITSDIAKQQARKSVEEQLNRLETELSELKTKYNKLKQLFSNEVPSDEDISSLMVAVKDKNEIEAILNNSDFSTFKEIIESTKTYFGDNIPKIEDIETVENKYKRLNQLKEKISLNKVSDTTLKRYKELHSKYGDNIPSDDELEYLDSIHKEKTALMYNVIELHLDKLKDEIKNIENSLGGNVPLISEIEQSLTQLDKVDSLKNINLDLAYSANSNIEQIKTREDKTNKRVILIIGILSVLFGLGLSTQNLKTGLLGIAIGLIFVIISLIIKPKIIRFKVVNTDNSKLMQIKNDIRDNTLEIERINSQVTRFVNRYIKDSRSTREKLIELNNIVKEYNVLKKKLQDNMEKFNEFASKIQQLDKKLDNELYRELNRYNKFDTNIIIAQKEVVEARELKELINNSNSELDVYNSELVNIDFELSNFMLRYYNNKENLGSKIMELKLKITEYINANQRYNDSLKSQQDNLYKLDQSSKIMEDIKLKYNLGDIKTIEDVNNLKDKVAEFNAISKRYSDITLQKQEIENKNIDILSISKSDNNKTLEELKNEEIELIDEIGELTKAKVIYENKLNTISLAEDSIIDKRDSLEYYVEQREDCTLRSRVLDMVIRNLTEAKESLSLNYLNKLQYNFNKYMSKLMPVEVGAKVNTNLDITIVRYGESKDKAYLSTGQLDKINICMRLALIDSIFEGEKPFIIMDDPFINLDDESIENSTNLIKEITKDYQVIYMTCSDSRLVR